MTRTEYIEALLPEVRQSIVHFVGPENERRARAKLDEYTTNELAIMYSKQKAAEQAPTPIKGASWEDVANAKQELQRDRERAEEARLEARLRLDASTAAHQEILKLRELAQFEPQDRRTFLDAAKTLRVFGTQQSNFNLIRQILGPGFDAFGIKKAIESGQLLLAKPTQTELEIWQAEDVEAHNQKLLSASPQDLRHYARQEQHQRRATALQQAETKLLEDMAERDSHRGFPELPRQMPDGTALDSMFFKKLPTDHLKFYIRKFGPSQVSNRINNK